MSAVDSTESFVCVLGFPGYEFSNQGRVASYWTHDGSGIPGTVRGFLQPAILRCGSTPKLYRQVSLKQGGRFVKRTVHGMIALAFLGPRPAGMQVCHWDNDGLNNRLDNLRYDTPKGNGRDRVRHGTTVAGEACHASKLNPARVVEIRRRLKAGETQRDLAAEYGLNQSSISDIFTGRSWRHVTE